MTQSAPRELTEAEKGRSLQICNGMEKHAYYARIAMREGIQIGRAKSASPETPRTTDEAVAWQYRLTKAMRGKDDRWNQCIHDEQYRAFAARPETYEVRALYARTMAAQPADAEETRTLTAKELRAYGDKCYQIGRADLPSLWQPIKTAPKDGTRVLVSFGTRGVHAVECRADDRVRQEAVYAERYRVLREGAKVSVAIQGDCLLGVTVEIPGRRVEDFGDKLDAAIDAAIAAQADGGAK